MKSYQSMKTKLIPIGIYNLAQGAANDSEIRAFARGIDTVDNRLDVIIREAFIPTAIDFGLSSWEEIFGPPNLSTSSALRRELLIKRLRLSPRSFTKRSAEDILTSLGIDGFRIDENPSLFVVTIDLSDNDYSVTKRAWIRDQLDELLPAHLEIDLIFGNISWAQIDSLGLTFQQSDDKGYTWDSIDSLKP